jgi:hypothetical protein
LRQLVADLSVPGTLREAGITDRAAVEELFAGNSSAREVIALAW